MAKIRKQLLACILTAVMLSLTVFVQVAYAKETILIHNLTLTTIDDAVFQAPGAGEPITFQEIVDVANTDVEGGIRFHIDYRWGLCSEDGSSYYYGTDGDGNAKAFKKGVWLLEIMIEVPDSENYAFDPSSFKEYREGGKYYTIQLGGRTFTAEEPNESFITYCTEFLVDVTDINTAEVEKLPDVSYKNQAYTPDPTITCNGKTLVNNRDYVLDYSNNVSVGTCEVYITGKGDYAGSRTESFQIRKRNISQQKITLNKTSFTYNGKVQKPYIELVGGLPLENYSDFQTKYSSPLSKNPGRYTVRAIGEGNCSGTTKTAAYYIQKMKNGLQAVVSKVSVSTWKTRKQKVSLARKRFITVKKATGKVSYKKDDKQKWYTVSSEGKIVLKKGLKKGKYRASIKITAAGNQFVEKKSITKTIRIVVK